MGIGFGALGAGVGLGVGMLMIRARGYRVLARCSGRAPTARSARRDGRALGRDGRGFRRGGPQSGLAIVGLFAWVFVVEVLAFQYLPEVARYAPGAAGTAMTGDTVGDSSVHLLSAPAGGRAPAGYAAAFVLAGAFVTARRDLT